jgi:hypothetical protein
MKTKFIFSVLFLAVFSVSALAQDVTIVQSNNDVSSTYSSSSKPKKPKFWIGPKFGTDFVGIPTGMDVVKSNLKEKWQAGVMMQLGRVLYLQPEAYYCLDNVVSTDGSISSSTAQIKVPAMLGLRFLNLGLFSLHIMGGPQWTIPLKDSNGNSTGNTSMDWQVGAGIDILGFITADVRYSYDTDIQLNDHITNFDFQTTPLNITVGLKLR